MTEPAYTGSFAEVQEAELAWIRRRREVVGVEERAPLVGLALSGGGIRSAAFNLGVLEALARTGLLSRIDYLSSVSGGGYIASCLTWLRAHVPASSSQRVGELPLAHGEGTVLDWLRAHGRYLVTGRGLSGWSLAASILAGTLLNLFVLLPLFLLAIGAASADWFALSWPATLHLPGAAQVPGHDGFMLIACLGGALLALYVAATFLFALSTALPPLGRMAAQYYFRRRLGQLLGGGIIAVALGALPVLVGIEETAIVYLRERVAGEVVRHATWIAPMVAGGSLLWLAVRATNARTRAVLGLSLLLYGGFAGLYHLAHHTPLLSAAPFHYWALASVVLALVCDINAISMHSYYRSRLAEAFLPQVKTANVQRAGARHPVLFRLAEVEAESGGPFHIINTTLNTTSSNQPKLRGRNGENMVLTPLYCGSAATGYRRTASYLNGELTLSTALAVSGAAIDPDMYATRARPISFLMTLLNVRLGIWTANPRHGPRRFRWPAWYQLMLREMLGIGLAETEPRIHLADGGHFENLGLYELLRRRCRYIIVSDAGADPDLTLADLGQAVQRARADFGANVELCADRLVHERSAVLWERAHLLGKVTYADGSTGEILYLKAMLREGLSADIYAYWRLNPAFPNQPTADQFFGEMQFDSYRELGLQLMSGIVADAATDAVEGLFGRQPAPADGDDLADAEDWSSQDQRILMSSSS